MIGIEEAIERGKQAGAMLYNRKSWIPEHLRDQELRNLYNLAVKAPDGPAVEIGTYKGGSIVCWAAAREGRGDIYGIDDGSSKVNAVCKANLTYYSVDAIFFETDSVSAALLVPDDLSFCFIDGNHGPGILIDVPIWSKKIRTGGIIIYHDYGTRKCPSVKIAVDTWAATAQWQFINQCGSSRAYRRPAEK